MRRDAFTLVELLLAVALAAMVAAILGALLHGLIAGDCAQTQLLEGPVAARNVLLRLSRETACAFAPPDKDITPLTLARSAEWGVPELKIDFYLPVPSRAPYLPGFYGVEKVSYELRPVPGASGERELLRLSVPCAGPRTNDVHTAVLLRGQFRLDIRVPDAETPGAGMAEGWPPEDSEGDSDEQPPLPPSLWFSLQWGDEAAIETESLVQCSHPLEPPAGGPGTGERPTTAETP